MPNVRRRTDAVPWGLPLASAAFFLLSGCASALTCAGKPAPGLRDILDDPRHLAAAEEIVREELISARIEEHRCWAKTGDQTSQYLMGFAHEHGLGVEQDLERARHYYKRAAAPRSNRAYVYSPPVGGESHGRVMPVTTGPDTPGLLAAKAALERLAKAD